MQCHLILISESSIFVSLLCLSLTLSILQDDVHVAEDGHICCVITIMQDDVTDAV